MLNLLFPKHCNGCKSTLSTHENVLCTQCIHDLPLVCHHRNNSQAMKQVFFGRFPVEEATALLQFQKRGITQELLHNLKYRGKQDVGVFFGTWLGAELADLEAYKTVDLVIPVPLHKQKLKKRGYNQVEGFGKEIAKALDKPYMDDVLLKISKTSSQVFKKRFTRFGAPQIFTVAHSERLQHKHILLVDDIVTTGATLENCALQLLEGTGATISLATMAITQ